MPQAVKPIPRCALELRNRLQMLGSVDEPEVSDWLTQIDLEPTPGSMNFVIGYGMNPKRVWREA